MAWHVAPGTPGDRAGIKQGDYVESVHGAKIHRATDVTKLLWRAGPWTEVRYGIRRDGESFEVPLVTAPQDNSSSIENYLRITALLYLFIGLFIFARRWNAPRAIHFYVFCLVSFVLYSFHYTGKLNSFDWTIYWGNVVALLLQPALLVHFALVFPERRGSLWPKLAAVYSVPRRPARAAHLRGHGDARFPAVDQQPRISRHDRAALSGRLFPGRRGHFPGELFPRAQRSAAAAIEVGHRRNVRRHSPVPAAVRAAAFRRAPCRSRG